jgi:hypothetical protein
VTVQSAALTVSEPSENSLDFTIPLPIHNAGSEAFTFVYCASRVEARNGDAWSRAWFPLCNLPLATSEPSSPNDILPGETRTFTVRVVAAIGGTPGSTWEVPGIDGSYRFVAGLIAPGVGGSIPTVASNEFTLSEQK